MESLGIAFIVFTLVLTGLAVAALIIAIQANNKKTISHDENNSSALTVDKLVVTDSLKAGGLLYPTKDGPSGAIMTTSGAQVLSLTPGMTIVDQTYLPVTSKGGFTEFGTSFASKLLVNTGDAAQIEFACTLNNAAVAVDTVPVVQVFFGGNEWNQIKFSSGNEQKATCSAWCSLTLARTGDATASILGTAQWDYTSTNDATDTTAAAITGPVSYTDGTFTFKVNGTDGGSDMANTVLFSRITILQ